MKTNKGQRKSPFTRPVHGLLLLDKPTGLTSNQALQKVRYLFRAKKAGHTGNLDPMASGLLPCCFGDATKCAHMLINSDKRYIATARLGAQTDSGDATGEVINTHDLNALSDAQIQSVLARMTGAQRQVPPMYSALHHNGQRLYELARRGEEVERPPRDITVHHFHLLHNRGEELVFDVKVSKGTYVRTLIEDFARACGTLAHLSALRRTESGVFNSAQMVTLEEVLNAADPWQHLQGVDRALCEYPRLNLSDSQVHTLVCGQTVAGVQAAAAVYRLYDALGLFVGLGSLDELGQLKVKRLFHNSRQQALARD